MKIYLVFANDGGEIFECCVSGHFVVFLLNKRVAIETIDSSFIDNFLSVIELFSCHFQQFEQLLETVRKNMKAIALLWKLTLRISLMIFFSSENLALSSST